MAVYLLHFDRPLGRARHYLGCTQDVPARVRLHRQGLGSAITRALRAQGIGFRVARVWWTGDYQSQRQLKRAGHSPRYCPLCRAGEGDTGQCEAN